MSHKNSDYCPVWLGVLVNILAFLVIAAPVLVAIRNSDAPATQQQPR